MDEWAGARTFLDNRVVLRDPRHVDYAFVPAADRPALGLVHDHACWVSGCACATAAVTQLQTSAVRSARAATPPPPASGRPAIR